MYSTAISAYRSASTCDFFLGRHITHLARDKDIFTLDETIVNSFLDTLADFNLVSIVACAIEMPIPKLYGFVDSRSTQVFVKLPGSHTDLGQFLAGGIESDRWRYGHGEDMSYGWCEQVLKLYVVKIKHSPILGLYRYFCSWRITAECTCLQSLETTSHSLGQSEGKS